MIKDTSSLDYMFVHTFGTDTFEYHTDFPFIALDFLKHAYADIEKYSQYIYADDSMYTWAPDTGLRYKILNMMLSAAKHGDSYASEMLCRIYKVYYKREYNQLKRFRTISYDELYSFENDKEIMAETAARILTICPFMGIEVLPGCELILSDVKEALDDETFEYKVEPEDFSFGEDLFREAGEEARELIKRMRKKDRDFYWRGDIPKYTEQVFSYFGLRRDFDYLCNREAETMERSLSVTIAILKKRFKSRSFTDEEILLYNALYVEIRSFTSQIDVFDELVDMMLGRTDRFTFEMEQCRYRPEKQKVATTSISTCSDSSEKQVHSGSAPAGRISSEEEESYIREINDLKAALKQKQQNLDEAKRQYLEAKEEVRQNKINEEQWEADRSELYRLREYVYSLTEDDLAVSSVSMEEMEESLKDRRIIIVGGHDNWVGYLKEIFPSWTYIKPSISNTLPESHAVNAEYLFFFTDTISHGSFDKYMNVVRKHDLPYSYLHGTNIERTVSSIYRELYRKNG